MMPKTLPLLALLSALLHPLQLHALEAASSGGELFQAIRRGDTKAVRQLLRAGAPVNARDDAGATALIHASLYGDARLVRLLLDSGAEVNATNKAGASALMRASGDFEKVRLLLGGGADPNARSAFGNTPLIVAARWHGNSRSVKAFLELDSDAYATGQALYALQEAARLPTTDSTYQRGLRFLLKTQLEDGTWFTPRRTFPFQPTMPSGFPHNRDGWLSAASTSWATLALTLASEPEHTVITTAKHGDPSGWKGPPGNKTKQ